MNYPETHLISMLNNHLIDHWDLNSVPQSKCFNIEVDPYEPSGPADELYQKYINRDIKPVCGNVHAGTGSKRVITDINDGNSVITYTDDDFVETMIANVYKRLGSKVLVSAGHFMPHKNSSFLNVNSNSILSLVHGLNCLAQLRSLHVESDLLISINDLTIGTEGNDNRSEFTLTTNERADYYARFALPHIYDKLINDYRNTCKANFKVFVIGENKLAEKLNKDTKKLVKKGMLEKMDCGYALGFDSGNEREIAHGVNSDPDYASVFISTGAGISGRPKCVRACARLSAIPVELGYSGYVQFLPVCSRNAIEGYLIGRKLYNVNMPFISIHNTYSCF